MSTIQTASTENNTTFETSSVGEDVARLDYARLIAVDGRVDVDDRLVDDALCPYRRSAAPVEMQQAGALVSWQVRWKKQITECISNYGCCARTMRLKTNDPRCLHRHMLAPRHGWFWQSPLW